MSDHTFQMRLACTYADPDNSIDKLKVDLLVDDTWRPLDLNTGTPGFDVFIYAIFTCQHMYFRVNAAERGLMLVSGEGSITVGTDQDRNLELLHVGFHGKLKSGTPTQASIDYIVERMGLCPVSRNIKAAADSKTIVSLE